MRPTKTLMLRATQTALAFQLRDDRAVLVLGQFSRIGSNAAYVEINTGDEPYTESVRHLDHRQCLRYLIDYLQRNEILVALSDLTLVIHRMPHGGVAFRHATMMGHSETQVLDRIKHLSPHLPACLQTLHAAQSQLPAEHIAVFDTAFMSTIPREASRYAMPADLATRFHLRRYGFHGIAHKAAYEEAMGYTRGKSKRPRRVVSIIIDEDVSVTALLDGIVQDTTTGFTVAEGLPGLHRAGSVDPRIPLHFATHLRASAHQVDEILSTRCGIAGMAGKPSYDEILEGVKAESADCTEALMHLAYRIAKETAGMTAVIGGIDLIVFSGSGASWQLREEICRRLSGLGVRLESRKEKGILSKGRPLVIAVDADEDAEILREAHEVHRLHGRLKRPVPRAE